MSEQLFTGQLTINKLKQDINVPFSFVKETKNNVNFLVFNSEFVIDRNDFNCDGYPFLINKDVTVKLSLYFRTNRIK